MFRYAEKSIINSLRIFKTVYVGIEKKYINKYELPQPGNIIIDTCRAANNCTCTAKVVVARHAIDVGMLGPGSGLA